MPILAWENDPASSGLIQVDEPRIDQSPFKYFLPLPRPNPDRYPDSTTHDFRYWNTGATLRRGADFWGPVVGSGERWHSVFVLNVRLLENDSWNSSYDRQALNLDRGETESGEYVYAADSADIVCHELGHAMLDIVKEELWLNTEQEVVAFRESFGDISAILCALQVPSFRNSVFDEEGGRFSRSSRLSRLAEQFGSELHKKHPEDADADCLRNAYNDFHYVPPGQLPTVAEDTSVLTSGPHSFSRVFTGAMFETLDGLLALDAHASADRLHEITFDLRDIVIDAVRAAPVVPQYYASVAGKVILAARAKREPYGSVLAAAFVRRSILSQAAANAALAANIPVEWV